MLERLDSSPHIYKFLKESIFSWQDIEIINNNQTVRVELFLYLHMPSKELPSFISAVSSLNSNSDIIVTVQPLASCYKHQAMQNHFVVA